MGRGERKIPNSPQSSSMVKASEKVWKDRQKLTVGEEIAAPEPSTEAPNLGGRVWKTA